MKNNKNIIIKFASRIVHNTSYIKTNLFTWFIDVSGARNYSTTLQTPENNPLITPVKIYSNPDVNKTQIIEENRNKAGVYRWVNMINNKAYIGSSINLASRLLDYYQISQLLKDDRVIDRALLKYGYSNFSLEIIEYCKAEEAVAREQYYFDLLKPSYNTLKTAGSTLGYRHTKETKDRMKILHLLDDELRERRSLARKGIKQSDGARARIQAAVTERLGIAVVVKNIHTNEETEYVNLTEAAKAIGVSRTAVKKALDLEKTLKKIYIIKKST